MAGTAADADAGRPSFTRLTPPSPLAPFDEDNLLMLCWHESLFSTLPLTNEVGNLIAQWRARRLSVVASSVFASCLGFVRILRSRRRDGRLVA